MRIANKVKIFENLDDYFDGVKPKYNKKVDVYRIHGRDYAKIDDQFYPIYIDLYSDKRNECYMALDTPHKNIGKFVR
jgi:hypothetical protein